MGILEVSRSIGDGAFKMHGVSCTPDVKKCQLTSDDR
jgi:integrin-linked kinase-associated serine/threonine phosphatase 2C